MSPAPAARLRLLVLASLLAGVTAVCALVSLPNPLLPSVPFTLQVFAVCLAGAVLPPAWAFGAEAVYLLLGALGLPVFAGGSGGVVHLFQVTGGFLWSYPVAAAACSAVAGRRAPYWRLALGSVAAIAVIYAMGLAGMHVFARVPLGPKTLLGMATFLPWDLIKGVLAAAVAARARRQVLSWQQAVASA
jgi:biotin transport system substrate-specific component